MALDALPEGMVQIKARVLVHRRVARDHFLMRLRAPQVAKSALPGQFIHLLCAGEETVPFLRRPFSLSDADRQKGTVEFIYKVVGIGTEALRKIQVADRVDLLGPLGRSFEIPKKLERAVLIGGGVGIPPLYLLAKWLKDRCQVEVFLGARTKDWVICANDFRKLKVPVQIATDDGTLGHKGSVVELVSRLLNQNGSGSRRVNLYICGPTPMMAAAAAFAGRKGLGAQVSLEERMGCAMGCCWGCVVEVTTEPKTAHARFQRVCTEGPVFPAEMIRWR